VVAEVRRSVQTLRTDAGASESLGAAVSALARHLSESSGIPMRVTVDEGTMRLRPEVESEMLRIVQEAMNNAVRHARPTAVEVLVRVAAPSAEVVVRDDGTGLGPGRADSHGLSIMRERAALVDGELHVGPVFPHGTEVRVRLGASRDRASTSSPAADGTVAT
jgi:signal transduction histidine kinase